MADMSQTRAVTDCLATGEPRKSVQELNSALQLCCLNCSAYYYESENTSKSCSYHRGKIICLYTSTVCTGAMVEKWTCCQRFKNDSGCCVGPHLEDKVTTTILRKFEGVVSTSASLPVAASVRQESDQTGVGAQIGKIEEEDPNFKVIDGNLFLKYRINPATDSLPGIALRFQLQVSYLKTINKIRSDLDFYSLQFILLPWKPGELIPDQANSIEKEKEEEIKCLVDKFSSQFKIESAEAKYYLHDANYSYEDAIQRYTADLEWEKQHNVFYSPQTTKT